MTTRYKLRSHAMWKREGGVWSEFKPVKRRKSGIQEMRVLRMLARQKARRED